MFGNQVTETIYSAHTFAPGTFYHVAGTYDGKTFRLYVNGVLEGSFKETKSIAYTSNPWAIGESFVLGIGSGFREWAGVIDEVQAFNRALSAAELAAIFKAGSRGECKGLLLNPTKLTFASEAVGTTSPAQTVAITNISGAAVSLTSISLSGADRGDFAQTNTCGGSLPAGGTCSISVTVTPSETGAEAQRWRLRTTQRAAPKR